jgi:hypothetical protein
MVFAGTDRERRREGGSKRYGLEVLERVIGKLVVQRRVNDVAVHRDEDGIFVRYRSCGLPCPDVAPRARYVFHIELLSKVL